MNQTAILLALPLFGTLTASVVAAVAPLRDKTLVVWAAPANLEQRGGGALTIDDGQGHFDGIIFGEHTPRKWMPGSEGFSRTLAEQGNWPDETADGKTHVQIAITYKEVDVEDSVYECPSVHKRFLHIPIWCGVTTSWVTISVDGVWQGELAASLARGKPDFYTTLEVGQWQGRKLTLTAEKVDSDSQWNKLIKQSDEMSDEAIVYTEKYRPQLHFSVRRGGLGDVNGPVYLNGEYHLFGQHRPFQGSNARGPTTVTWSHAISTDLVHWVEYPEAVFPDKLGLPFSGTGVVDWKNTAGLVKNPVMDQDGKLKNPAIVLFHTSYPLLLRSGGITTQSMVYSLDAGRTWMKYPGNPVVPHFIAENRDPKVFRYDDKKNPGNPHSGRWVMVLYLTDQDYALLTSQDLIHWERASGIDNAGCIDCPDMFELPVDGDKDNTRWIFWGGSGSHLIGKFDGQTFVKEAGPLLVFAGTEYAGQTFSDIPEADGRRIQIANSSREVLGMPFEGQLTIPRVLSLRTTPDGIRLFVEPAKEIEQLRTSQALQITGTLAGTDAPLKSEKNLGELVDAEAVFEIQSDVLSRAGANVVGLRINGQTILCDLDRKQMKVADIPAPLDCVVANKIKLRVILDRMSIEVFVNDGAFRFTKPFIPADGMQPDIQVFGKQGLASVTLIAYQLQSIWNKKPKS